MSEFSKDLKIVKEWRHWDKFSKLGDTIFIPGTLIGLIIDLHLNPNFNIVRLKIYTIVAIVGILFKIVGWKGGWMEKKIRGLNSWWTK